MCEAGNEVKMTTIKDILAELDELKEYGYIPERFNLGKEEK